MTLLVCDLSNNNPSPIDFGQVRRHGVYGCWLKVSEGLNFVDPDWHQRAKAARTAGLHVGGYHFARPGSGTASAQAEFFVSHLVPVERRDLHPVLDLEVDGSLSNAALHTWARTFLEHVNQRIKVKAVTYSSPGFILPRAWDHTFGTGAGLWLADYGPDDGTDHGCTPPKPWRQIVAHQYTSKGHLLGVSGNVDLSHARARRRILAHGLRGIR
jgi:GH25 family lysozyme M1 (1,4-beta-N-acetylmuramidase)